MVLSLELSPKDVVFYESANWTDAFGNFSHGLTATSVIFDPSTNRLRIALTYS